MKGDIFSLGPSKQRINQWLGIAFVGVLCFWVVLYYFTSKAQIIGESFVANLTVIR